MSCGTKFLAKSSSCPTCRSAAKKGDDEITKKVVDDNDLHKGW